MTQPNFAFARRTGEWLMSAQRSRGQPGSTLTGAYSNLLVLYLLSLLYLYPYGFALSADTSMRLPDVLACLCLSLGASAVAIKARIRLDIAFFVSGGAFVLLELATPILGAAGYQQWTAAASGLRMAMLWIPTMFLVMLAGPIHQRDFEQKLAVVLAVSLWLNLLYAFIQIAVDFGRLPRSLLITEWLEPWAIDRHFRVVQGLRPAGFFVNTTSLSVFGVVSLCFFYARYVGDRRHRSLFYTLLALLIIILTTSRMAAAAAFLIISVGWLALPFPRKAMVGLILSIAVSAVLVFVQKTVGIEEAFYRFQRLLDSGVMQDVSLNARIYHIWPTVLDIASQYPFGTLIAAPRAIELIDSGYLTYFVQAKWLFIAALLMLLAGLWVLGVHGALYMRRKSGFLLLFLAIYLSLALFTSNPLRTPVVIFFIVYAFWMAKSEGEQLVLRVCGPPRSFHQNQL